MRLPRQPSRDIHHAGGLARNVPVYLVNIALPNRVQFSGVEVAESVLPPGLDVVVGMDIITRGDFAVTNRGGKTTFSFRIPSQVDIDFVKDDNAANQKASVLQSTIQTTLSRSANPIGVSARRRGNDSPSLAPTKLALGSGMRSTKAVMPPTTSAKSWYESKWSSRSCNYVLRERRVFGVGALP